MEIFRLVYSHVTTAPLPTGKGGDYDFSVFNALSYFPSLRVKYESHDHAGQCLLFRTSYNNIDVYFHEIKHYSVCIDISK